MQLTTHQQLNDNNYFGREQYERRTILNVNNKQQDIDETSSSTRLRITGLVSAYIDEGFNYDNTSPCNITNPCSSLGQLMDYLASLNDTTPIIVLRIFLMSNVTVCKNNWRNELNPTMEIFLENYPNNVMRTINCGGSVYFNTEIENSKSRLNININRIRFERVLFKYGKDRIDFSSCILESCTLTLNNAATVRFTESMIYNSGMSLIESYLELKSSTLRKTRINGFSFIGGTLVFPITMNNVKLLDGSEFSAISYKITIQQLIVLDSSVSINSSPNVEINNITSSNSNFNFQVINRLEIYNFELSNNVKPALFSGINIINMINGTIRDCPVASDGALAFRTILSMSLKNLRFIRNWKGIFADNIKTLTITKCEFLQNSQGMILQNFEKDSLSTCSVYDSLFIDNYNLDGNGGAFQTVSQDSVRFVNCRFENNYARNGGAIYSTTETSIERCVFRNNSAVLQGDCSEITCGNGGSVYSKRMLTLEDVNFLDNRAVKGGAYFLDHVERFDILGTQSFKNNIASFAGDDVFLYGTYTKLISATKFAQSNIQTLKLMARYDQDNILYAESELLSLYPGQSVSFTFELFDMYGNQIKKIQTYPKFISSSSDIVLKAVVNSTTNTTVNSFSYEANYMPSEDFLILITFDENFKTQTLNVRPIQCPYGYSLRRQFESEYSQLVCVRENYEAIIASSVMGTVLVIIVLIGCSLGTYFIGGRMLKLYKREQAEKNLARKLIDKQFIFGGDSELTQSLLHSEGKAKQLKSQCDNMIIPLTDIEIISKIGEGSNGVVYKARWNGIPVALKTLKVDAMSEEETEQFEHEAALLSSLKHPSIVTFFGISIGVNVKYIIVEFMPNGSLDYLIRECKSGRVRLSFRQKISIMLGIANGLLYLHNLKPLSIIHRDIKPGNILLDYSYQAKVSDFGLSKLTSNTGSSTMTSNLGTVLYMAPELIMEGEYEISHKLDVYSYSIIMYELFFEEAPFSSGSGKLNRFSKKEEKEVKNLMTIPWLVAKGERPKIPFTTKEEQLLWIKEFYNEKDIDMDTLLNVVTEYIDLMKLCWSQDPELRPSFAEVVTLLNRMLSNWKGV